MEERDYIVLFHQLDGVGSVTMRKLYNDYGSLANVLLADADDLKRNGIREHVIQQISELKVNGEQLYEKLLKEHQAQQIHIITIKDEAYPKLLREIFDPPYAIFVKGDYRLLNKNLISVVGTREPSYYGKWAAKELGAYLAKNQVPIVSGLAKGIDRFVHEGALNYDGKCIAVVATGLAYIYPAENRKLHDNILEAGGCVISEYSLYTKARPGHFPARNRIISGLSLGTVVVESKEKGGALITADQALEQNREVFALPGNINCPTSVGTNYLLKQGAKLLMKWEDIFDEIQCFQENNVIKNLNLGIKETNKHDITNEERKLLSVIPFQEIHIDELLKLYLESDVYVLLIQLQLKNYIEALPGQYYVRLQ
ncbi:DNA-processing protein DprA [Desulfuribacillus alkaliarsenatis]|uniref:DNA protecting protein DprA n=1 Tax=Desulfuribacillus alkaliarsenatis TaxID=766136 RepID=A0A1E5G674_9FIRM|nr:DNA-processing protein DprA [Desulfuribacillus alkaliarsenatis]OEF98595.1 DNA protecting protein DprA [Desulfuribacillus alkaliarsenatis]